MAVSRTGGATPAATDAACLIFQQPNFFAVSSRRLPSPRSDDAEAIAIAHVDPISLGVLEAPGA